MTQITQKYDLEERTAVFGENIIILCKEISPNSVTRPLINQVARSATSIGANYVEANGASSKKDFRNKIFICKKESQETRYWLRMLITAVPVHTEKLRLLLQEYHEFVLIFQKIGASLNNSKL